MNATHQRRKAVAAAPFRLLKFPAKVQPTAPTRPGLARAIEDLTYLSTVPNRFVWTLAVTLLSNMVTRNGGAR